MRFDNIHIIIRFRDENYKKRTISANSRVEIFHNSMQIISKKLLNFIKSENHLKMFNYGKIPEFNEKNLPQILNVAKIMKISWPLLMNIYFKIENISLAKYKQRIGFFSGGSKNLILNINSKYGEITLELEKKKFNAWTPSQDLIEIANMIDRKKYSRVIEHEVERNISDESFSSVAPALQENKCPYCQASLHGARTFKNDLMCCLLCNKYLISMDYQLEEEIDEQPMEDDNKYQLTDENYEEVLEFCYKELEKSDDNSKKDAIITLGEIGDQRAFPYLEKFLEDDSKILRKLSKKAIESIKRKGNHN